MIAYFILVHRYPNQLKRLFRALYDPKNYYVIHVDKRAGKNIHTEIQEFLASYPNTHILKSQNVVWGGYSMVEAELRGMKKLLELDKSWDYFINLSGQDFPLKTQDQIASFLKHNKGKDFLLVSNQKLVRPNTMNRIQNYFTESTRGFVGKPSKRAFLTNITPYIGGQWKILSRKTCEFISSSPQVAKFRKYYKNTLIPDESFFQTVLMNTSYNGTIINNDQRAIIWIPDVNIANTKNCKTNDTASLIKSGKIKLRPKTFTIQDLSYLRTSSALFARKFDETVDRTIIDHLEIDLKPVLKARVRIKPQIRAVSYVIPVQSVFFNPAVL